MPHALLVDDDEAFVAGLAAAVAAESFTTTVVGSLAAARAEITRSVPDVLLLDIHLPDGNGLDLFKDMQTTSAEIVLMTGKASVETAVEALRHGAADYLVKPVDLARLKRVLANASRTRDLKALVGHLPWAATRPARGGPPRPDSFGRYVVEGELGDGAMGRVYRGQDPLLRRPVAVKTVKSEYLSRDTREEYLRRFRREAQAAGMLSHPNIVGIFDVGEDFIVMEYVEGVTLQGLLRHRGASTSLPRCASSPRSPRPSTTRTAAASSTATSSRGTSWCSPTAARSSWTSGSRAWRPAPRPTPATSSAPPPTRRRNRSWARS